MTTYFVSRHAGATEWARRQGLVDCRFVDHLAPAEVRRGDVVIGTLPVSVAAEVCSRGARYLHLTLDVPSAARGRELTPELMEAYGATLREFVVTAVEDSDV